MSYAKPPVLNGSAKSDYENYLRTDELLSLQGGPANWLHRDELLFTVVHQVSELWLKLATSEILEATEKLELNELREAQRLLNRAILCILQTRESLELLETMSPWDYQQVRRALGHGSGFDSPGFNSVRLSIPRLGKEFFKILREQDLELMQVFKLERKYEDLYQLAELLLTLDEAVSLWRAKHIKVVARTIGIQSVGTQGTPVEDLMKLSEFTFFPLLWDIRNQITELATQGEKSSS
jgi:tryptophan 2,3-dioxygenase